MAKSYTDYLKEILAAQKQTMEDSISASNSLYDSKKDQVKKEYVDKIRETDKDFLSKIKDQNLQELIEKRKINEKMGNLGLIDSGYNKAHKDLTKKFNAIKKDGIMKENNIQSKKLQNEMNDEINALEVKRAEAQSEINEDFLKDAQKNAEDLYKADLKAKSSSTKKSTSSKNTATKKEEAKEPENNPQREEEKYDIFDVDEDDLTEYQKYNVRYHLNLLPERADYFREKKLDKSLPAYDTYIINYLDSVADSGYLCATEYNYILKKLGVKRKTV